MALTVSLFTTLDTFLVDNKPAGAPSTAPWLTPPPRLPLAPSNCPRLSELFLSFELNPRDTYPSYYSYQTIAIVFYCSNFSDLHHTMREYTTRNRKAMFEYVRFQLQDEVSKKSHNSMWMRFRSLLRQLWAGILVNIGLSPAAPQGDESIYQKGGTSILC